MTEWREALACLGVDPSTASVEELAHNRRLTPGIWRVMIAGRSMILKCLSSERPAPTSAAEAHWTTGLEDPRRWNYWAREGLAYRHHIVEIFDVGGIVAPALLDASFADNEIILLLEYVDGRPGEQWDIADYALAARAMGRAHGHQLSSAALPEQPWFSRGFLRDYSGSKPVDWALLNDDHAWDQPLVRRNFPPELREAAIWLHTSSDRLYAIAETLPRVVCHLDFWTKNLIKRSDGRFVLLDWAFVGDGAIGEDIGNLVPDAAFDHFIAAESLPDLELAVVEAYTDGLAESGLREDPRLVEIGMCASAIKYDWLTPAMLASASTVNHVRYGGTEAIDPDFLYRERGLALLDNARRARRALTLADELRFV